MLPVKDKNSLLGKNLYKKRSCMSIQILTDDVVVALAAGRGFPLQEE
jgi:hypothetical protein